MNRVESLIVQPILAAHPRTQAIYLYGTWGTEYQHPGSDIDLAVLLPHGEAKKIDSWNWNLLAMDVARAARVERTDLINLRCVDVTFEAEIMRTGKVIYCIDEAERLGFEMLVLSMHQRLNRERAGIREEIITSGRVLA